MILLLTFILQLSPANYSMEPVQGSPLATVLELATQKSADVAINGGFFRESGEPAGALKIDQWISPPYRNRGVIGWNRRENLLHFGRLDQHNYHLWDHLDYIVGGAPLLIKNGIQLFNYSIERVIPSFLELKHRRTAVGELPNHDWVLVVTDEEGLTMKELLTKMHALGCINALNLDGGGSSTLVIKGKTMTPLPMRPVSDAIVVLPKNSTIGYNVLHD